MAGLRAETKRATRAALIAAGLDELAASGLDASLDDICARAGYTRGAFYVHFRDRDDFLVAVMDDVLVRFVALLTAVPGDGGLERAVRLFFAAVAARAPAVHGGGALRFQHLLDACRRSPVIRARYHARLQQAQEQLVTQVRVDQAGGRARADLAAEDIGALLVAAALGVVALLELELPLDPERMCRTVLGALAPDVTAAPARPKDRSGTAPRGPGPAARRRARPR
jgi:AcrR family transcriptional regulator